MRGFSKSLGRQVYGSVVMSYIARNLKAAEHVSAPDAVCPVEPTERIRLKQGFGKRFIVMVDTEEEFDWQAPFSRTSDATTSIAALPAATARFNAHGVQPVYLCDYPVITRPESAAIVRDLAQNGSCDVGAHLHPWVTPPHTEDVTAHHSFTGNLPPALQREKLHRLTDAIEAMLGRKPTVFRAGRYGLGQQTMSDLAELGYRMDASVRSLHDYSADGGPCFSDCPIWPWRTKEGIVELPLTSGWIGVLRRFPGLYDTPSLRGALSRAAMLSRIALTPEGVPASQAAEAIRVLFDAGLDVFSLSFHSPTLTVGFTPYTRSERDMAAFWNWWDVVLNTFAKLGIAPVRYDELINALERA